MLNSGEQEHISMLPHFSLVLTKDESKLTAITEKYGVSKTQINLAWLLHKSDWLLPIPGTSSLKHLEANLESLSIRLTDKDMAFPG